MSSNHTVAVDKQHDRVSLAAHLDSFFADQNPTLVGSTRALVDSTREMASMARSMGYHAFGAICLHVAELIEDIGDVGQAQEPARLRLWLQCSAHYLRSPRDSIGVTALINSLSHFEWRSPLCAEEEILLRRELQHDLVRTAAIP
jgi:hypothetical protein